MQEKRFVKLIYGRLFILFLFTEASCEILYISFLGCLFKAEESVRNVVIATKKTKTDRPNFRMLFLDNSFFKCCLYDSTNCLQKLMRLCLVKEIQFHFILEPFTVS